MRSRVGGSHLTNNIDLETTPAPGGTRCLPGPGAGRQHPPELRAPHWRARGRGREGGREGGRKREREGGRKGGRRRHVIRFPAPLSVHSRRSGHNHSSGHWGNPSGLRRGNPCGRLRSWSHPCPAPAPLKFCSAQKRGGGGGNVRGEGSKSTPLNIYFQEKRKRGAQKWLGQL